MRSDGTAVVYQIEHQQKDGSWVKSNLDHFGYPEGFDASDDCWQKTGIHGVFKPAEAKCGLKRIRAKNVDHLFRIVLVTYQRKTETMPW